MSPTRRSPVGNKRGMVYGVGLVPKPRRHSAFKLKIGCAAHAPCVVRVIGVSRGKGMELRHLRCFIVLAEELHFSRAADRPHIEQPPLSRTIKEPENSLGVVLFDRDRRGIRLTAAGAVFRQDIYRLFTVLEQARENTRALAAGLQGRVRITASERRVESTYFGISCRMSGGRARDRNSPVGSSFKRTVARP